jgi:N-acetyl-1-D-myo-inositol-2-amino-2-deoxy-alpha-D-glucopyranoside deacetylase
MDSARRATLLMVVAHPDDEIFYGGILTHLAQRGARVQLLALTHGEAGKVRDPSYQVPDLGAVRAEELALSCERLGIEPPRILDFHDSGRGASFRADDPGALANADPLEVEAAVRSVIADIEPHVLVTHDPHGGYDHPDHIATWRATTAAFYSSGHVGSSAPERLFYGVIEQETFRTFSEVSRGRGPGGGLDADVYGVAAPMIAVSFDARPYYEQKLAALAAHRTQFGLTLDTVYDPPPQAAPMLAAFRPVFERESFVLAGVRGPVASWPMADFFDRLETAELSGQPEQLTARR